MTYPHWPHLGTFIRTAVLLALTIAPANAWGLLYPKAGGPETYLTWVILTVGHIDVCIANRAPDQFPDEDLRIEFQAALDLWLSASKKKHGAVHTTWSRCVDDTFNLQIFVGPGLPGNIANPAYVERLRTFTGRTFSKLTINTSFREEPPYNTRTVTFASLIGDRDLKTELYRISQERPLSIHEYADATGIDVGLIAYSTYMSFLHEIGHTLGLCDLAAATFYNCRAGTNPPANSLDATMLDNVWFYLQPDDIAGVNAAFDFVSEAIAEQQ
jgi:hypothetical protein